MRTKVPQPHGTTKKEKETGCFCIHEGPIGSSLISTGEHSPLSAGNDRASRGGLSIAMLLLSVHLGREGEPANQGEGQAASLPCRDPWSRRGQGTCRTQPRGLGLSCHLENVPAATPCLQSSQWLGAANKHPLTLGEMGKGEDSLSLIHQMFIEFLRACVLSRVQLSTTPWTITHWASLSMDQPPGSKQPGVFVLVVSMKSPSSTGCGSQFLQNNSKV